MKHTDLMLNDLVMYQGEILRVGCISDYDIKIDLFEDGEDTPYAEIWQEELDEVEPIPLTTEILEKNGWKWNAFYTMIDLVVGTIHIGWGFYKDCISVSDHSDEGHCQISSLRCEYVHELQHALRLCGIDKTIEI